jgi:hypothetical protein
MAKRKLSPIVKPNTLKSMIEYMLISSILDKICKMIKKPLEDPRDNTKLNPFKHLFEIRTWGTYRRMGGMVMGKCKDGQRESFYNETKFEHFQG